ncbi:MAG TPA: DUF1178 family protein [Geminicoccaceae bacterium]
MILFDLVCSSGHGFEGWFKDGEAFEAQVTGGELACPVCGDRTINKALMAPAVRSGARNESAKAAALLQAMKAIRSEVERTCEHVGPRFAEEARKIHYGESERRGIYGEATENEARSLKDEGIEVARVPWIQTPDA